MNKADKDKQLIEDILFFIRGYFVPLVGTIIIIMVVVFIYIPNITGIFSDVSTLSVDNTHYTSLKNRTYYLRGLSTSKSQLALTNNIIAVGAILPDQTKSAESINTIQNIIIQDGLTVNSASSALVPRTADQDFKVLDPNIAISEITFHISGGSDKVIQMMTDVAHLKDLSYISNTNIQGNVNTQGDETISLTIDVFALNSSDIAKNLSLLSNFTTSYTADQINGL